MSLILVLIAVIFSHVEVSYELFILTNDSKVSVGHSLEEWQRIIRRQRRQLEPRVAVRAQSHRLSVVTAKSTGRATIPK